MNTSRFNATSFSWIPALLLLSGAVLLSSSGCSSITTRDLSSTRVVDISSDAKELQELQTVFQGETLTEPLMFVIPAGFSVPVRLGFNTPIAELAGDCGDLVFTRVVYLYLSEQTMLLSPDRNRWASIGDLDAIKELFGLGSGEIRIGIGAERDNGPLLEFEITAHPAAR